MPASQTPRRRQIISWALYDWANSAFATVVMAGFFPVFFKKYWAGAMAATESTFLLGSFNSLASLLVVALAPVLGAIADRGGAKKRFLIFFTLLGVLMTGGLFLAAQGDWLVALVLYALGVLGFSGGNVFYDALLVDVAEEREFDRVSAFGFALGYLGGGLLFAFTIALVTFPEFFGLADSAEAVRWSFIAVALWWALFSLPVMLLVHEARGSQVHGWGGAVRQGWAQLRDTFRHVRQLRMVFLFLLAYWLYIDGVDTIVRMAVDYGLSLGFDANGLMAALLLTQFVGFPAAILFGRLGERYGPRRGIFIAIAVYMLVVVWAYRMQHVWEFYALAATIGLVQGGIQALSRSFYARLIPRDKAGEFFGFYNMLGKFAAVAGPLLMAWVGLATGSSRLSILSLLLLFIAGVLLLARVDEQEGRRQALAAEGP